MPSSLSILGSQSFASDLGSGTFTSVTIPASVTSIGNKCFGNSKTLQTVTFLGGLSSVPASCFSGCISLATVKFRGSVNSFGDSCFYDCQALSSITDESKTGKVFDWGTIKYVGDSSFYNCQAMRGSFTVNRGATIAENAMALCDEELFNIHK